MTFEYICDVNFWKIGLLQYIGLHYDGAVKLSYYVIYVHLILQYMWM